MQSIRELLDVSDYRPKNGYSAELVDLVSADLERAEMMENWVGSGRSAGSFYKTLKSLKDSLVDYSYLDKSGWEGLRLKRMEVWEKFRCIKQSFIAEKRQAATSLAIEVVQLAQKFGFSEIVLSLASDLEHHFGVVVPDTRRFLRYKKLRKVYSIKLTDELEAKALQVQLVFNINKGKEVKSLFPEVEKLISKKSGTAKFMQYRFGVLSVWYDHLGDVDSMKKALDETLRYYEGCTEVVPNSAKWSLYFRTVPLLVREKRFLEASALVSRALQTVKEGTHNWHAFMLQRAEIGFASGKPGIALGALKAAENAPKDYENQEIDQEWERVRVRLGDLGCYR